MKNLLAECKASKKKCAIVVGSVVGAAVVAAVVAKVVSVIHSRKMFDEMMDSDYWEDEEEPTCECGCKSEIFTKEELKEAKTNA